MAPMARRSKADIRHGIRIRSAERAAAKADPSACGGVPITTRSAPPSSAPRSEAASLAGTTETTAGASAWRVSRQPVALACGSRSRMTVAFPAYSAATARLIASVVLPAPPFWDAIATVLKAKTPLPAPIKQELRHTSRSHGNAGLRFAAHTGIRELHRISALSPGRSERSEPLTPPIVYAALPRPCSSSASIRASSACAECRPSTQR